MDKNLKIKRLKKENKFLKAQHKQLNIYYWIVFSSFIIFMIFVTTLFFINSDTFNESSQNSKNTEANTTNLSELNISYDDLNQSEIKYVNKLIRKLKPEYLILFDKIIFTKNKTLVDKKNNGSEIQIVGMNINQGEIIKVLYQRNLNPDMESVLCHELLHSLVRGYSKETEEWFIDDIDKYRVCYKNKLRIAIL